MSHRVFAPPTYSRLRRGAALPTALLVVVLISLLVSGSFLVALQEFRVSRNNIVQTRALAGAEYGLVTTIAKWDNKRNGGLITGDTLLKVYQVDNDVVDTVVVTKLNAYTYELASNAVASPNGSMRARRRLGELVRLNYLTIDYRAALTAAGPVVVDGAATISGANQDPNFNAPGDSCTPSAGGTDTNAVAVPTVPMVTLTAGGTVTTGAGAPIKADTMAAQPSTYTVFAGLDYATLAAGANITVPMNSSVSPSPVFAGSTCNYMATNWGDIDHSVGRPCAYYFPLVRALGNLTLSAGGGQGVLLVDGNLTITGGFTWIGIVIVRGFITTTGPGNLVNGAMLAGGTPPTPPGKNTFAGGFTLRKSGCAVELAARNSAYVTPIKNRAWFDIF